MRDLVQALGSLPSGAFALLRGGSTEKSCSAAELSPGNSCYFCLEDASNAVRHCTSEAG